MKKTSPPRVAFVSLGCPKNLVDSEKMLGSLAEEGCVISGENDADVIVINTCGFLQESQDEALAIIREALAKKRAGQVQRVVVAGCLVTRLGAKLRELSAELGEIDGLVGVNNRQDLVRVVQQLTGGVSPQPRKTKPAHPPTQRGPEHRDVIGPTAVEFSKHPHLAHVRPDTARLRLTPRHYAYLRVSEGCNQKCTFCTIPSIRGRMCSKPVRDILREVDELLADGTRELNLIGQDTTSYGEDLGYDGPGQGLTGLIRTLDRHVTQLQPQTWLRLMYAYPSTFTDEMIGALAAAERFVPYIDMPLQHISNRVLKAMHRRVTRPDTERLITRLRREIPHLSLRTTFIVGFPGETEAEFAELLDFVQATRFDMLGVFAFSAEPGTPAARMKDQVPDKVKQERKGRLMLAQQKLAFTRLRQGIGQTLTVLVDSQMGRNLHAGRHAGQAPEVDSIVAVQGSCRPGEFVEVEVTGTQGYDWQAKVIKRGHQSRH